MYAPFKCMTNYKFNQKNNFYKSIKTNYFKINFLPIIHYLPLHNKKKNIEKKYSKHDEQDEEIT